MGQFSLARITTCWSSVVWLNYYLSILPTVLCLPGDPVRCWGCCWNLGLHEQRQGNNKKTKQDETSSLKKKKEKACFLEVFSCLFVGVCVNETCVKQGFKTSADQPWPLTSGNWCIRIQQASVVDMVWGLHQGISVSYHNPLTPSCRLRPPDK